MLFSNHKFIFLCCVAAWSASFILNTIVRHDVVGHYSWFRGRDEWESGTDWLFSLIVCGMIVGGAQAVRRTLLVVIAAGTPLRRRVFFHVCRSAKFIYRRSISDHGIFPGRLRISAAACDCVHGRAAATAPNGPCGAHRRCFAGGSSPLAINVSDRTFARKLIPPFC